MVLYERVIGPVGRWKGPTGQRRTSLALLELGRRRRNSVVLPNAPDHELRAAVNSRKRANEASTRDSAAACHPRDANLTHAVYDLEVDKNQVSGKRALRDPLVGSQAASGRPTAGFGGVYATLDSERRDLMRSQGNVASGSRRCHSALSEIHRRKRDEHNVDRDTEGLPH